MNEVTKKGIAELSTDTRILIQQIESRLVDKQVETLTYDELSKAIGRDIKQADHLLRTARRHAEKNNNVLIDVVIGVGLKLTDDYSGNLQRATEGIRRRSKRQLVRTIRALSADENVGTSELTEINTRVSVLGVINEFTRPKTIKKIREKVQANSSKEIPTAETLQLFG